MGWWEDFSEVYDIPESYFKPLKDKTLEEVIAEGPSEHDKRPKSDEYLYYLTSPITIRISDEVIRVVDSVVGKHKNARSRSKVIAYAMKLGVTFDSKYEVKPYGKLRNLLTETVGSMKDEILFELVDIHFSRLDTLIRYKESDVAGSKINVRPFWWVAAYISDFAPKYNVYNKSFAAKLLLYYGLSRSEKYVPSMYKAKLIDKVRAMVNAINEAYRSSWDLCKKVCWALSKYDAGELENFVNKIKKIDGDLYDEIIKFVAYL